MSLVSRLNSSAPDFQKRLEALIAYEAVADAAVQSRVAEIIANVRKRGDQALVEYTREFDHLDIASAQELEIPVERLQQALNTIPDEQRDALQLAAQRIRDYAEHQRLRPWEYTESDGTVLGQRITPLDRAGLYAPGGKAAYPSSVLMNAIPARVAGVSELIMASPSPGGELNELVLAAAAIAGVDRFFSIGGAQAVAALAYGTEMVPAVDKIVGPGNVYVAAAKRQVFGTVGIDMIAGPSEILVICDGLTDPEWIVMDLFSQAEHDEDAQSILLCPNADYLDMIDSKIESLLIDMPRKDILMKSLRDRTALIQVNSLDEAVEIANYIAPEHLELSVEQPELLVQDIRHAGAIFMGRYTAEALGDYCAGPNHVLPTSRTARFSSPLGVYDFQKRSSLIHCSKEGAARLGATASVLARGEGLVAHARSAEARQ